MNRRSFFPNFITCLNLLAGCLAVVTAFNEQLILTSYLIFIAAVLDFFDGLVARLVKGASEIGMQLDSLADMVSFGLAPGVILYQMITVGYKQYYIDLMDRPMYVILMASSGFLVTIFVALRLARFNVLPSNNNWFSGMPSPAVAIFFATFPFIMENQIDMNMYYPSDLTAMSVMSQGFHYLPSEMILADAFFTPGFLISLAIIFSLLMVVPIRFFTMKFKSFRIKENLIRYIFILLSALTFYIFYENYITYIAFPFIIILYVVLSISNHFLTEKDQVIPSESPDYN